MKIAVAGTGYVGLSNAILISQRHEVVALDIVADKVRQLNDRVSPIADHEIEDYLKNKKLNLRALLLLQHQPIMTLKLTISTHHPWKQLFVMC
jgi:UDPglucose 6-dehydrogenase